MIGPPTSKITITGFALLLLLFFGNSQGNHAAASATAMAAKPQVKHNSPQSQPARRSLDKGDTGTLQKMIVENGTVTINLDPNRLNGIASMQQSAIPLQFAIGANSFFSILVFNDVLRGPEQGSMALVPMAGVNTFGYSTLPALLSQALKQLVVEKLPFGDRFDLAVRDAKTGFTFFNVEGHQYDYDANAHLLSITGGRLLISNEFARALGRGAEAAVTVGQISIGAEMEPIEVQTVVNGETRSVVMPPLHGARGERPTLVAGPDVIVGEIPEMAQYGNDIVNHFVGLGIGTTSCNP